MFDRSRVKLLRQQLEPYLAEFGKHNDVAITLGRATFTADNVSFKMEVARLDNNGNAVNRSVSNFQLNAGRYGLQPSDLHREFVFAGKRFKITGLQPRRSRYPISCECTENGKNYKFASTQVLAGLANEKKVGV